ncbi:2-succinylbenzoate-CoA ligase [Vibrio vulnificus]|uniref:o-succinylbenzoate--CoA ligase n=1 Tax=Vibrio vulnificus TaxID=672 RepID=UPI000542CD97|nr:o-succinylbenzoate--CoA ligase [Vibrio vulnificus]KHF85658.1 O-succinylbenzoic acid--CoA ligase [Vibrio vulnificus]KHF93071.1 O-succinylbenzoic acid--CoA ligase [Vibrio vulnificus]PAO32892.1 2-succinylbenzoate-CoA ligase [Vibrio vulnificus]PAO40614.1 2-succinylbenzoate-CoA ligase [Vibrio vulnificus]
MAEMRTADRFVRRTAIGVAFIMGETAFVSEQPLWKYWAQQSPFSMALTSSRYQFNWQQLNDEIERLAAVLGAQGVARGDVITLLGKNHVDMVLILLAAHQLGAVVAITMPQSVPMFSAKLETLYREQQTRFIWLDPNVDGQTRSACSHDHRNVLLEISLASNHLNSLPDKHVCDYRADQLATIIFTSGSTGNPKAVAHTHRQHFASAQGLLEEFCFTQQDTWLLSLPLYHVSGMAIVYRWLFAGACLKVGHGALAEEIQGVTHVSLVATQLKRLLDDNTPLQLSHVLLGGSHVEHTLAQAAQRKGIETWLGYGMTEAASTVTAKQIDSVSNAGHLLKHRALQLVGQRIYIGGETLAEGYFFQGNLTTLVDEQGWFDSKDLGVWQGEELKIIGRADNQFISGGENIHCEEIEAVLNEIDGVEQSIVVPMPDEEFGYRPVAVIQSPSLANRADYEQHLKERLQKFKWPVAYYQMPEALLKEGIKVSRQAVKVWLGNQLS